MQVTTAQVTTAQLRVMVGGLSHLDAGVDDAERVDQIRLLEELKAAAAAAQARVTVAFTASQKAAHRAGGVPEQQVGRGVASQVALAKRESPARARRYVGWAGILVAELPCTFRALRDGRITEWRAQLVARETAWLSREHRAEVDAALAPELESWGDRQVEAEAKKAAYRLDPHGYLARIRGAEADRRVSLRPAPDTMSRLSGLLPVAQGVAVYAALTSRADNLRAAGDERSRGQIMADTLVERVTGQGVAGGVPVEISLLMSDQTLFNHGPHRNEPAVVPGQGPIPADLARRLAVAAAEQARLWVRRLYADPGTGGLVAMDSRRRCFDDGLARFLVVRDQSCRTPWCDAPIRHHDHVHGAGAGGMTSADNGQGLCEACNQAKEGPGWRARPGPDGAGADVVTTTPTGHRYHSRPPGPPRTRDPVRPVPAVPAVRTSELEAHFAALLEAA